MQTKPPIHTDIKRDVLSQMNSEIYLKPNNTGEHPLAVPSISQPKPDTADIEPTDPPIIPPTASSTESDDDLSAVIQQAHEHLAFVKAGVIDEIEDHPRRRALLRER